MNAKIEELDAKGKSGQGKKDGQQKSNIENTRQENAMTKFCISKTTFCVFFTLNLLWMTSKVLVNSCNISPHQVFIIKVKFEWL